MIARPTDHEPAKQGPSGAPADPAGDKPTPLDTIKVRRLRARRRRALAALGTMVVILGLGAWPAGRAKPVAREAPRPVRQTWVSPAIPVLPPGPTDGPPESAPVRLQGDDAREFVRRLLGGQEARPPEQPVAMATDRPEPGRRRTVEVEIGDAVEVVMRPARPEESYPTVVLFPLEEEIAEIVTSWRETDLSILRRGNTITLKLLSAEAHGELQAVAAGGAIYRLFVRARREGEGYDGAVIVRLRSAPAGRNPARSDDGATALAAAMVEGDAPAGVTVLDARRAGEPWPLATEGALSLGLLWVYESAAYRGYVIEARNTGKEALLVQPERFAGSGLVLVGADRHTLAPGEATRVYMVLARDNP